MLLRSLRPPMLTPEYTFPVLGSDPVACLVQRYVFKLLAYIIYSEIAEAVVDSKTVSAFDSSASWVDVSRCEIESSYIP